MLAAKKVSKLFIDKPIEMKCIVGILTAGIGDIICQNIYPDKQEFDYFRLFFQSSFGCLLGPYSHLHINIILPKLLPKSSKINVIKSVVAINFNNSIWLTW